MLTQSLQFPRLLRSPLPADSGSPSAFGPVGSTSDVGPIAPPTHPTDAALNYPGYETAASDTASAAAVSRGSLISRALYETFGKPGARIAAVWVAILLTLAVFAPFLANSRPYVAWWADGSVSYPLFAALTWVDMTLLCLFFAGLFLVVLRRFVAFRLRYALLAMALVLAVAGSVSFIVADPPRLETYETWREAQKRGELKRAVMAPVAYSPNDANRDQVRDRPQQPPSSTHWLGTTIYGEDLLSRMIFAARIALAIGFIATGIAAVIGITIGGIMGYFAGTTDLLLMRFVEIVEAVPRLVLLMIVVTFFTEGWLKDIRLYLMMVTIGLISWTTDARFIRAEFLKLRKQDFVQAGVATGLPLRNILFRHMLPNGVAPVLVNVSFGIAGAILLESILSFLGLGLEAEDASWGQLLDQARQGGGGFNWWIATFPGLAIFLTVFAYILIGEAMRDAIDPKLKKAGE
jgi:peptide/nickel transport system permease protein